MSRNRIAPNDNPYSGPRWQKFYPETLAYNVGNWQTRVGRRNRQQTTFSNLLGLNTAFDDLHKSDGESPYLRNVRYMGEKQNYQRAQVTSRNGAKLICTIGGTFHHANLSDGETDIELYEGKVIRFKVEHDANLVALQLYINNVGKAKGRIRVVFKNDVNSREVCDANIDLERTAKNKWVSKYVRPIIPLRPEDDNGEAIVELSIMDDVEPEHVGDEYPSEGRKVLIKALGNGVHEEAKFVMPSQEQPYLDNGMRELPLDFQLEDNIPLFGYTENDYRPLNGVSPVIHVGPHKYLMFAYNDGTTSRLCRVNLFDGSMLDIPKTYIAPESDAVRFAICKDYVYFVDGVSPLRRVSIKTWKSEKAIADPSMIDAPNTKPQDLQAKKGASIIFKLRNRLYLSGFKDDPNFVQVSLINSKGDGVQYDQYAEGFYSPDRSPKESTSPITAIQEFNGSLIIFRKDGCSQYTAPMGVNAGAPKQMDGFSFNMGVERQDDVTNADGHIYFYNKSEGLRRYSGADALFQSAKVDNELRNIPESSHRFMMAHGNKVRFYFDRDAKGYNDHSLVYHIALARQSPWYMDNQTPVMWAVGDDTSDTIYAMHNLYPALYIVDDPYTFTDFDSSIPMEYDTMYKSSGEIMGYTMLRRVEVAIITNDTNSWFIGIDKDHRSDPAVFRKFVSALTNVDNGPDSVYDDLPAYSNQVLHISLRMKCRQFNVRVKCYSWRGNAQLLAVIGECGMVQTR